MFDVIFIMCYLQDPPFNMEAPKKKTRKTKNRTGEEVVQSVLKTPEPPMIENAEPLTKEWTAPHYTTGDKIRLQKYLDPEPQMIVNKQLPSYEEMQEACRDLFNGPSSMETQPDLAPAHGRGSTSGMVAYRRGIRCTLFRRTGFARISDGCKQTFAYQLCPD